MLLRIGIVSGKFFSDEYNEYLRKYFNRVEGITAVCIRKYPLGGDSYLELERGKTYQVAFAGATDCNKTLLMLEDFPFKEYNSVCFDVYDNGVRLDYYWEDPRFQCES